MIHLKRIQRGEAFTANQLHTLSAMLQRSALASRMGKQFNGKRDMYEVLGYNKDPGFDDFYARYDRQDIAGRIVDMPAAATWRNAPEVREDDDKNKETPFEEAWNEISDRLRVNHYMERVDRLAGIGRYAVLLIGVRGSGQLNTPLVKGAVQKPEDIIYLSVFSEKSAPIEKWVTDPSDPRFGKPEMYKIDFAGEFKQAGFQVGSQLVHHSRVIHVAEGLLEDEVYGRSRLRRVHNLFDDLAKTVGGSAEMFWRGAERGLHANLSENARIDDPEKLSEEIDEYIHGLRRFIRTQGMDVNVLQGQIADPRGNFEVLISLVAGATGIPKRVLLGAERGELASSQDETNWNSYVHERQIHFAEPQMLRPFIDKLIELGALPEPKEPYFVEWPNLFELDEKEKSEVTLRKAQAIQAYAPFGETERVVPIAEFREKFMGLDPDIPDEYKVKEEDDDSDIDPDGDPILEQMVKRRRGGDT